MNKETVFQDGMVSKGADVRALEATDVELEMINKHALHPLTKEDVYVFKIAISDNELDRQHERFTTQALKDMADLFIGKPLIKDHVRSADNQIGRIYAAEVFTHESEKNSRGEPYTQLVAKCYVLDTDSNKDLLSDIRGGIKKEVSVNLRVGKATCNICKVDNAKEACPHWWGVEYEGVKCHFILEEPTDAYEVSFVAVPAQAKAGTIKEYSRKDKKKDKNSDKEVNAKLLAIRAKAAMAYVYIQSERNKEE